jgi:hypothetical protein
MHAVDAVQAERKPIVLLRVLADEAAQACETG